MPPSTLKTIQEKDWIVKSPDAKLCQELNLELKVDPVICRLLINRGITTVDDARRFLTSATDKLHDPFQLKNMDKLVSRIQKAKDGQERVLVFGDYDVDGVTSSTILNKALINMGLDVIHHIPHRMHDGYGLNHEIAGFAEENDVKLLISVDCGITAVEEIDTINKSGIDVIVVDHHEPGHSELPDAYAIINPKQKGCAYPFKELAAVGLAFKISQALLGTVEEEMLHLAALGTVADIVPLVDENRIIVKSGLDTVNRTPNKGLKALMKICKIGHKKLTPYHIGFILGPRINAAGRMDTAHTSLDLFLSKTDQEALQLAEELNQHNSARQRMQREVVNEALAIVEEGEDIKDHKVIVLDKEGWHKGVIGIVASRITDKFFRPSIVISVKNGIGTASARSINGFHIHDALAACGEYLEAYGGHQGAAGMTIKEGNINLFREKINKLADETLEIKKLTPKLEIDCELDLKEISLNLAQTIDALQPYGEGNPTPIFCSRRCVVRSYPQILGKETIKFWVAYDGGAISAVGFGMAKFQEIVRPGSEIDLAYQITIDDWNKAPTPQLQLKDIKLSE